MSSGDATFSLKQWILTQEKTANNQISLGHLLLTSQGPILDPKPVSTAETVEQVWHRYLPKLTKDSTALRIGGLW